MRLICSSLILALAGVCHAADYYVDLAGDDANAGSAAAPWRTLQHAAGAVGPGDRVTVRPGDYAGFHLTTSGTAGSPIEFLAEPGVLISATNPVTNDGINLEGASHVVIDGFEVVGMPRAGVRSVGPFVNSQQAFAEFVTIRDVTSRDNGKWGILTGFVNDLLIEDNRTSGSIDEHGIYVGNSGDRPVIRGNEIFGNRANGIHVNADRFAGLDGVIEGALIAGNTIYDNGVGGGSGINMDGVQDSRIENNLIYNSHASGISLYQIDGAEPSTGNVVINNTVHQAADGRWALNLQDGAANNTVANNIFISDHSFRGAIDGSPDSLPGLVSDYNAVVSRFTNNGGDSVESLAQWRQATGQDTNSLIATAAELFVDPVAGDYRLASDSPARNAGWNLWGAGDDLLGVARPVGARVDIGAYEFSEEEGLQGDYNGDGAIGAVDYAVWREGLGGEFSPADFETWLANYGSTILGTTAPAPEPYGLLLAVPTLGCLLLTRPQRMALLGRHLVAFIAFGVLTVGAATAWAIPLPVVNPGFEDTSGSLTFFNEFSFGSFAGWTLYDDPPGTAGNGAGNDFFVGTLEPTPDPASPGEFVFFPGGAPEGTRVAIAFNNAGTDGVGEYGLVQTLTGAPLQSHRTYLLRVEVGNIASGVAQNGVTFNLDGFPGYRVDLLAGGVVIASDNNSLAGSIDDGAFATSIVSLTTGAAHPQLGQDLGVRLVNLNQLDPSAPTADLEVDFDDVRLEMIPALAGDFDFSGAVDAVDYAVWREALGEAFAADDFVTWRENFGAVAAGAGQPLPEPRSALFLALVSLTHGLHYARR